MEREEILTLLDIQRKYFNDSLDRLQRQFTDSLKDADKRINDVITSLEYTQSRLDDALDGCTIRQLTNENERMKMQLRETKDRLDYLDDQSRRNNLRFSGVPELPGENWEQSQHKIAKLLQDKMNMKNTEFDRVHRVGRFSNDRPRDIVAKFSKFPERDDVYRNRRKLMGTNIFINEDLCPATMEIRREQMDKLREARSNGRIAYFNYRTLVVRGQRGGGSGAQSYRRNQTELNTTISNTTSTTATTTTTTTNSTNSDHPSRNSSPPPSPRNCTTPHTPRNANHQEPPKPPSTPRTPPPPLPGSPTSTRTPTTAPPLPQRRLSTSALSRPPHHRMDGTGASAEREWSLSQPQRLHEIDNSVASGSQPRTSPTTDKQHRLRKQPDRYTNK